MPKNEISISADRSGMLEKLTPSEINSIEKIASDTEVQETLRHCILAVLAVSIKSDDFREVQKKYSDFSCQLRHEGDFLVVDLFNFPEEEILVDGQIKPSVHDRILSVVRDIVFFRREIEQHQELGLQTTELVYKFLKGARIIEEGRRVPDRVVCFGGHSINREEFEYTKEVGNELGQRGIEITTGSGSSAMEGPMRGAAAAYVEQKHDCQNSFPGFTEVGIIMSEKPNSIVNKLIVFPDIEKRLEAFVRANHAAVFFPGGTGTMEELMYLLAIMMRPENKDCDLPIVLTARGESGAEYWRQIHAFVGKVFGPEAQSKYQIVIDVDSAEEEREEDGMHYIHNAPKYIGKNLKAKIKALRKKRKSQGGDRDFNWQIKIPEVLQEKFEPTHENVADLRVSQNQEVFDRIVEFRKIFSAIVAGNVKPDGVAAIAKHGKFRINVDPSYAEDLAELLQDFADDQRMKISGVYDPCYEVLAQAA
ncbi:MAG: nucleotide 5'-monophosphate nucleosidase PpnN [Candidatus Peribacteraceae bacterium]|nr:nucleotide 5'-monophosphate nucleosidase PpnN [Candidatus Peribacteraceae bacterium]